MKDRRLRFEERCQQFFYLESITEEAILHIVGQICKKKAPGVDKIRAADIIRYQQIFAPALVRLVNVSIETGCFPDGLKTARVTPVFKGGEKNTLDNCGPISTLSVIDKVMERHLSQKRRHVQTALLSACGSIAMRWRLIQGVHSGAALAQPSRGAA
ncbi:hypothetical protein Trydic_g16409 [Trypoxylus dichotomus]